MQVSDSAPTPSKVAVSRSHDDQVLRLRLDCRATRNALDRDVIENLIAQLRAVLEDQRLRVIMLSGSPVVFSAGADLDMMRDDRASDAPSVGAMLAEMLHLLWSQPAVVLCVVEGPALGGGAGLVAASDIVLSGPRATFGFPEVRLGLMPAVIAPYVIRAIGERKAQELFLMGGALSAQAAFAAGLVHELVDRDAVAERSEALLDQLLLGAPEAQRAAKQLVRAQAGAAITAEQGQDLARAIDDMRAGAEAQDGISAFLAKRRPPWAPEAD